jgi:hypothetical protein
MADDSSNQQQRGPSSAMVAQKALFAVWLAFLVAAIVLFAVIGVRHG